MQGPRQGTESLRWHLAQQLTQNLQQPRIEGRLCTYTDLLRIKDSGSRSRFPRTSWKGLNCGKQLLPGCFLVVLHIKSFLLEHEQVTILGLN